MKTITVYAGLVIMILCARPIYAQNNHAYTLSLSPQFGFLYGQAEEVVYPTPSNKAELLSQLLWDMKPFFYYGLSLDFSQVQPMAQWGFFAGFSLKNGISGSSGKMEDRDWMSMENAALTHYSIHDNTSRKLLALDGTFGLSFPLDRMLLLRTYVKASYMQLCFSGRDGTGTYARHLGDGYYAPITESPNYHTFSGAVINYTQEWFHIAPGFSVRVYFLDYFFAEFSYALSPLVWCVADDQHLTTNNQYQDYTQGMILIEPGLHFSFIASQQLEFSLDCSWQYISRTRGGSYSRSPIGKGTFIQTGEAGASLSVFDTGLCVKVRL